MPEHDKIEVHTEKIRSRWNQYIGKNKDDTMALVKSLVTEYKWFYTVTIVSGFLMEASQMALPVLTANFIAFLESDESHGGMDKTRVVMIAVTLSVLKFVKDIFGYHLD